MPDRRRGGGGGRGRGGALNRAQLDNAFSNLIASGDTAVYDAARAGFDAVARLRDATRINAVVVLSDGVDNGGRRAGAHAARRGRRRRRGFARGVRADGLGRLSRSRTDAGGPSPGVLSARWTG